MLLFGRRCPLSPSLPLSPVATPVPPPNQLLALPLEGLDKTPRAWIGGIDDQDLDDDDLIGAIAALVVDPIAARRHRAAAPSA